MTIGLSRNNPGNLMPAHVPWLGLTPAQPDNGPLQFDTVIDGIRAFVKLCYYYQSEGLDSPFKFVWNYYPPPNPTTQYLENVCSWTGYKQSQVLDFHDTSIMTAWAGAVFREEQGINNGITNDMINAGIAMAEGE